MYSAKYKHDFLEIPNNKNYKFVVDDILTFESEYDTVVYEWNGGHVSKYLKSFYAKSPSSINKHMIALRKFANFVAINENTKDNLCINNERFFDCIDISKIGRAHV